MNAQITNENWLYVISIILACAAINRIRGGLFGPILPKGKGDDFAALLFGWLCGLVYNDPLAIPSFALAFRLGEAHGWGHWLGVLVNNATARPVFIAKQVMLFGKVLYTQKHESPIDYLIAHVKNPTRWALYGTTLRGIMWGAILGVPAYFFGDLRQAVCFVVAGSLMGVIFLATRLVPGDGNKRWAIGEWVFGAFGIGTALAEVYSYASY